jgi:hypothetical protein
MTRDIINNLRGIVSLFLILGLALFSSPAALGAEKAAKADKQKAAAKGKPAEEEHLRFKDNGDGTVLDTHTDILWPKEAYLGKLPLSWQAAQQFVQEMNNGERPNMGYTDWRLPTINELETSLRERPEPFLLVFVPGSGHLRVYLDSRHGIGREGHRLRLGM